MAVGVAERAGRYVRQPTGYRAFVPAPLPPEPPLQLDLSMAALLSRADRSLGRLDGLAETLPNPDLFVAMYVRQEAVLSSQIEGTQSTLEDVLAFEVDAKGRALPLDVQEVVNYVRAMSYGLDRLHTLPLSLRLIREVHGELLTDVRGADRRPGEFRTSQNWIGPGGALLNEATFVPPAPTEMLQSLDNLEKFLHTDEEFPPLIHAALAHAQFETIHPFLDGNGRVGRLLITLQLVQAGALRRPLLYLSHYLVRYRAEYYDRLSAIREAGDWEGWVRFFLRGVAAAAEEATRTAAAILWLRAEHRRLVEGAGVNDLRLLEFLFERPLITASTVEQGLDVSPATAGRLIGRLAGLGLLEQVGHGQRNRLFRYAPYLALFEHGYVAGDDAPPQTTETEPN